MVTKDHLSGLFWADETSKVNYKKFGDIVSFDATYHTHKYDMIFVPFTGIDNHKHPVTFGGALIGDETTESYMWLLTTFLKAFTNQPKMVVTNQDAAVRNAKNAIFTQSRHRLCMWHISRKLGEKVPSSIFNDEDFKKTFYSIVYNKQTFEEEFDNNWEDMIDTYYLHENLWFSSMYERRETWIPSYMQDFPLSGLMRTTSRSECENNFFSYFMNPDATLMNFMSSFESAMEKQRHNQSFSNFQCSTTTSKLRTPLRIESHACAIYTRNTFLIIQRQIYSSLWYTIQDSHVVDEQHEVYYLKDTKKQYFVEVDKDKTTNNEDKTVNNEDSEIDFIKSIPDVCPDTIHKVEYNKKKDLITCNKKDLIGSQFLKKRHFSEGSGESIENLFQNGYSLVGYCMNKLANDMEMLKIFIGKLEDLKSSIMSTSVNKASTSKEVRLQSILGASVPQNIQVKNPEGIRNKGTGNRKRIKSGIEIASEKKHRTCSGCGVAAPHNLRTCPKRIAEEAEAKKIAEEAKAKNIAEEANAK